MNYRRKRINGLPPEPTRAIDDELFSIERVADYLQQRLDALTIPEITPVTDLSVTDVTDTNITVASSTGTDAILPASTTTTAGVATAAQATKIAGAVQNTISVNTQNGLQGGGTLTVNRTLSPIYGDVAGTICAGDDVRLNDKLRFKGNWVNGTYNTNDLVITPRWLARANKTTAQNPYPTTGSGRQWLYPVDPTWVSVTENIYWGFRVVSVVTKSIIHGIRVKLPTAGEVILDIGDGTNIRRQVNRGLVTAANTWTTFMVSPIIIYPGQVFDVSCFSGSHYKSDGFFAAEPNGRGIKFSTYPPSAGNITTTRYGIDILYEQPTFPSDWDYLSGY